MVLVVGGVVGIGLWVCVSMILVDWRVLVGIVVGWSLFVSVGFVFMVIVV